MAAHALDWGDSLNQHCRGGKQLTMMMMFVWGVVSVLDGIPVLFLPYKTYGAGVFCFCPNQIVVKLLTNILSNVD
jgi:hypothetical protein